jgi:hypothetical protein
MPGPRSAGTQTDQVDQAHSSLCDQDIGRFHIAVHKAFTMLRVERFGELIPPRTETGKPRST